MSYTKIMPRRGTKYEWTTKNPILAEGEFAVEFPESGIGTGLCRFKFGDGVRPYKELPYAFDGASASSVIGGSAFSGNTIQIRGDTHENWLLANPVLEENELIWDSTLKCFYVGDGISRFNQLEPAGRQLIYDFGDEDADLSMSIEGVESEGSATLSDILGEIVPPLVEEDNGVEDDEEPEEIEPDDAAENEESVEEEMVEETEMPEETPEE